MYKQDVKELISRTADEIIILMEDLDTTNRREYHRLISELEDKLEEYTDELDEIRKGRGK